MKILNTTPFTDDFLLKVSKGKDECKGYDGILCYFQETLKTSSEILIMSAKNFDNIRSLGFKKGV